MSAPRLKAEIWVQAMIRQCRSADIDAYLVRRGDETAGSVLLKVNRFDAGCFVLTPTFAPDGGRAWMRGTGPEMVPEPDADAYIQRQLGYDPDVWVLEIEDRAGLWELGEPVI